MSRRVTRHKAHAMGRGRGRSQIVLGPDGSTYEVLDLPGGGRRVFALEFRTVEPGTAEYEAVVDAVERDR